MLWNITTNYYNIPSINFSRQLCSANILSITQAKAFASPALFVSPRFVMPEAYWDTALLERWLEEKAVQGWRPVSFSRYGSGKFEPAEPRKLRYRLEPLRTETYDAQCEREETYREMGWEPAGVLGTIGSMPARTHRRRSCLQIPLPCV